MNLLDVKKVVENQLPERLVFLADYLGMTLSVHPPDESHVAAAVSGGAVAYIYATDHVVGGAEPPWRHPESRIEDGQVVGARIKKDGVIAIVDAMCVAFMRAYNLAKQKVAAEKESRTNTHMLRVFLPGGRITVSVPQSVGEGLIEQWRKIRRGETHDKDIVLTAEADDENKVVVHGPAVAGMMLTALANDPVQEPTEAPTVAGARSSEAP